LVEEKIYSFTKHKLCAVNINIHLNHLQKNANIQTQNVWTLLKPLASILLWLNLMSSQLASRFNYKSNQGIRRRNYTPFGLICENDVH